jgi:LacI family transcriptional regulator
MARVILLTDFSEEYAKRLLRGIVQYSKEHQPWVLCKMPLSYRDLYEVEGVLEWAIQWKADGIIAQFYSTDRVGIFKENGIVAIAQDFKSRFAEIPNITGAHRLAGKMGANYFIRKGFRNFAFYGLKDIVWSQERYDGFKDELSQYGMDNKLYEYKNEDFKGLWYYESVPLISWLETLPKPVAMMACDDSHAHHIAELCQQYRIKIPEEISLLGVDNDEAICTLSDPPLSSLDQAVEHGGYETARLLDKLIANPNAPHEDVVVYPTHVVTRQSTDIYATGDKYIATVLKHIHQHADKKLNIGEMTQLVPLSRRLLEERFKKVTGFPVYTYIMNFRINKFAEKLLETDHSIIEIVTDMGFSDYKNMARLFKQVKGCTPSEYRMKYTLKE